MKRSLSLVLLLALAAGCATGGGTDQARPANIAAPEIIFAQQGEILFGGGTEAPIRLDVQVQNRANVPLVLREIEVSSPDMVSYGVLRTVRYYNETIPPGETRIVPLNARAATSDPNRDLAEPLSIRAWVRFDAAGIRFRELVQQRIVGRR